MYPQSQPRGVQTVGDKRCSHPHHEQIDLEIGVEASIYVDF
jgi:hypothetical protein